VQSSSTLFVQTFDGGSLQPTDGDATTFVLTLQGDSGHTVAFSDRPERVVSAVSTQVFLDALGFSPRNPPNAALVIEPTPGQTDIVVLELFDPVLDAAQRTLTYTIRPLADYNTQMGLTFEQTPRVPNPAGETFGGAQLFIDDCPPLYWCSVFGITDCGDLPGGEVPQCWADAICAPQNCTNGQDFGYYNGICETYYHTCCDGGCIVDS